MKTLIERSAAFAMDSAMCGVMNLLQWRGRELMCTREQFDKYIVAGESQTREEFYAHPQPGGLVRDGIWLEWRTPAPSGFLENDRVRAWHFSCGDDKAPTVLILHALMSASDTGYRKVARWFNERGWNAVFPHLPYHYSRTPRGFFNGELGITANVVHNSETLRQGVKELRQLMAILRASGTREFGVLGTSFGGWNGALLSFLERDFRFLSLIQPIVNVEHAIWKNPSAATMRRMLRARGITPSESSRHSHLTSPLHGVPLCGGERTILTAGTYDTVSPAKELDALKEIWPGSRIVTVRQGHFGYAALRETLIAIEPML
jgi:hypothetical protein